MAHVQQFLPTARIKRVSLRPTTIGLPSAEAAMQRARESEARIAKQRAGHLLRVRLIWLALGVLIGFTAGHFTQFERPVMQQGRR